MEIIGAGYGRTGTLSTYTALNELGYKCYHMVEVLENPANKEHLDFWHRVGHSEPGIQHDWSEVFENYDATVDNPGCCVWRELVENYPDAKVVLTLHPKGPEGWYRSTINTIYKTESLWQVKVLAVFIPKIRKMVQMCRKLIWQRSHQGTLTDPGKAIERYQQHIEEIKAGVPEGRLLIYSVDQGWEPLCNFLGKGVPAMKFPNVNDTEEFQTVIKKMRYGAYGLIGLSGLVVIGTVYAALKVLGGA